MITCTFSATNGKIPTEYQLENFAKMLMLPFKFTDLKNSNHNNWANYLHELGHWALNHPNNTQKYLQENRPFQSVPYGWGGLDDICVEVWCLLVLQAKGWINPMCDFTFKDKYRWHPYLSNKVSIFFKIPSTGFYLASPDILHRYNKAIETLLFWDINPLQGKYRPTDERLILHQRQYKNGKSYWCLPN